MTNSVKPGLLAAFRVLLRPLIRILLRHGISFAEFAEIVKAVYVEIAVTDFKVEGKRGTKSRIAVISGLTRKEVSRVIELAGAENQGGKSNLNRVARVLAGWHTDPDFIGPYGMPLEIRYEDSAPNVVTFSNLVRRYSGDMSSRSMLDELVRVGAVVETEPGWLKVLRRVYEPQTLAQDNFERVGEVVKNFVDTVDFNLQKEALGAGRFERIVYSPEGIRNEDMYKFNLYVKERCQALLEEIDNWIAQLELPNKSNQQNVTHTGIGIYHYIERKDEKQTFKEKLAAEGLLKE
ncbi:MAG: DUF6502 family protein [Woeseia sp.]